MKYRYSLLILILWGQVLIPGMQRARPTDRTLGWWPLPNDYGITSHFGDFRPFRFHFGVDFSTNQEVGLPVRVWKKGVIYRVRVDRRGYGRAIYVLHPDGLTTVYAHLQRFASPLEELVHNIREESGEWYIGDFNPDTPVPVENGEIIGYSGETGEGMPHLHFEVRDANQRPLNPMGLALDDISDQHAPVVQGLIWVPADEESTVNGALGPRFMEFNDSDAKVKVQNPIVLSGPVELLLAAYDPTFRPYARSPAHIIIELDGVRVYEWRPQNLQFHEQPRAGFSYDFAERGPSYWVVPMRITSSDLAPSGMVEKSLAGPLNIEPGRHLMRIIVIDYRNHKQEIDIPLIGYRWPVLDIQQRSNTVHVEKKEGGGFSNGRNLWMEIRFTGESEVHRVEPDSHGKIETRWDAQLCPEIRLVAQVDDNLRTERPIMLPCGTIPVKFTPFGFQLISPREAPDVPFACSIEGPCGPIVPWNVFEARRVGQRSLGNFNQLETVMINPGKRLQKRVGLLEWDVPEEGTWKPSRITLWTEVPREVPEGLTPVSPVFHFEPASIPFPRPHHWIWRGPSMKDGKPLGIFWYKRKAQKWIFGGEFPNHPLQIASLHPVSVVVALDNAAPKFTSPSRVPWNPATKPLRIPFEEIGFGIREDRMIVKWDGVELKVPSQVEIDPDYPAVVFSPSEVPSVGSHKLEVVLEDWSGNRAEKNFIISVQAPR